MKLSVDIVTQFMSFSSSEVWNKLKQSHPHLLEDTAQVDYDGDIFLLKDFEKEIKSNSEPDFGLEISEGEIHYGHIRNYNHSLIWISNIVSSIEDSDIWINPFLEPSIFIQAWVYDTEYNKWQNTEDPLIYEAECRSCAEMSMKSNGLPFPLEKQIVDISNNPGRRTIKNGYIEAVGAVMWLGKDFFNRAGITEQLLSEHDWLNIENLPGGVFRLQAASEPFTSAENSQKKLQDNLRNVLYSNHS